MSEQPSKVLPTAKQMADLPFSAHLELLRQRGRLISAFELIESLETMMQDVRSVGAPRKGPPFASEVCARLTPDQMRKRYPWVSDLKAPGEWAPGSGGGWVQHANAEGALYRSSKPSKQEQKNLRQLDGVLERCLRDPKQFASDLASLVLEESDHAKNQWDSWRLFTIALRALQDTHRFEEADALYEDVTQRYGSDLWAAFTADDQADEVLYEHAMMHIHVFNDLQRGVSLLESHMADADRAERFPYSYAILSLADYYKKRGNHCTAIWLYSRYADLYCYSDGCSEACFITTGSYCGLEHGCISYIDAIGLGSSDRSVAYDLGSLVCSELEFQLRERDLRNPEAQSVESAVVELESTYGCVSVDRLPCLDHYDSCNPRGDPCFCKIFVLHHPESLDSGYSRCRKVLARSRLDNISFAEVEYWVLCWYASQMYQDVTFPDTAAALGRLCERRTGGLEAVLDEWEQRVKEDVSYMLGFENADPEDLRAIQAMRNFLRFEEYTEANMSIAPGPDVETCFGGKASPYANAKRFYRQACAPVYAVKLVNEPNMPNMPNMPKLPDYWFECEMLRCHERFAHFYKELKERVPHSAGTEHSQQEENEWGISLETSRGGGGSQKRKGGSQKRKGKKAQKKKNGWQSKNKRGGRKKAHCRAATAAQNATGAFCHEESGSEDDEEIVLAPASVY